MLYKNFTRLLFPKICIFLNTRICFDGGNQQFIIDFFGLVHSDPIYKTEICNFICYNWAEFWFTDQRYQHDDFNKLKETLKPCKKVVNTLQRYWDPDPSVLDIPRSNQCADRSIKVMHESYYMCKNKDKLQLRFILSNKH